MTLLLLFDEAAMSPTFSHGRQTKLYWGAYDVTSFFRQATVDASRDVHDTSAFGQDDKTYIPGLYDGTFSADGMYDSTDDASADILAAALAAQTTDISLYQAGDALGSYGWAVHATETSHAITSPVDDINAVTAEAQSSVGAERVFSLHPLGEETADATGTSIDGGVSSAAGLSAYLHVTGVTAGSVAVKVQHSTDDSTWVDLITFTTATALTTERKFAAGTVNRYLRVICTVVTGPVTFQVGASRIPLAN